MQFGFSKKIISGVVCQKDGATLSIKSEEISNKDTIFAGNLICVSCGTVYNISDGILDMMSTQGDLSPVLLSEKEVRDTKAYRYDAHFTSRYDREVPQTMSALGDILGKKIIEYGCGTGRLSIELSSAREVLVSDFSKNSLLILADKINDKTNFGLVLANSITLKTTPSYFDLALSAQVFEHIPDRISREIFLNNVSNTLVSDGRFVSSVYHYDLRRRIKKEKEEGFHDGKIFFHYFRKKELEKEFSNVFQIKQTKFIDITLPFQIYLGLEGVLGGKISSLCEKIPSIRELGHLLLITAVKKRDRSVSYEYGFIFPKFLNKKWFWFKNPHDVSDISMVTFFSYDKMDLPGFKRKDGLTSVIDLNKSQDDIWAGMRQTFICEQIKRGQNNGIIVKHDDNFSGFKKILDDFRKKKGLPEERFKSFLSGTVFSAYHGGILLAGIVYIGDGESLRAWQIASKRLSNNKNQNGLIGRANRMVVWEAIKYAKVAGYKRFDLGGINPTSKDPGVVHVAEFKESFGGERIPAYHYTKIYSKILLWYNGLKSKLS